MLRVKKDVAELSESAKQTAAGEIEKDQVLS